MGVRLEKFISVDVEAAGPIPGTYSMVSLGACVVGNTETKFYAELLPINDEYVKGALEAVGRPLSYFVENGRKPQIVMNDFSSWIDRSAGGAYPIFVGFNAPFDWAFINWYFHTYLGDNPFGISGLDVKSFYMGMTGCSWAETRSSRIPERYKGLHKHTHNALDDAIEQAELFEKLWQESKTKNSSKVDQSR